MNAFPFIRFQAQAVPIIGGHGKQHWLIWEFTKSKAQILCYVQTAHEAYELVNRLSRKAGQS